MVVALGWEILERFPACRDNLDGRGGNCIGDFVENCKGYHYNHFITEHNYEDSQQVLVGAAEA